MLMPLESSVSDDTIWSITLELSIMLLEVSFTLICAVYNTGVTYYDQLMRPLINLIKRHPTQVMIVLSCMNTNT
jgi:hypothetical protein